MHCYVILNINFNKLLLKQNSSLTENKNIKIFVNDKFYKREKAKVSVFDSGFLLGDGVWSGIRYHNNKFLFLKDHLIRLFDDAKKIDLKIP